MLDNKNTSALKHIINYCNEIEQTIKRFGNEYQIFSEDKAFQYTVALCVLQIGELTTHLSEEFKDSYNEIPWNQIKALRNLVAHNYGKIDKETLWETIILDIPKLKEYCDKLL